MDLFEDVYEDHPPVILKVANGKRVVADAVGSACVKLVDTNGCEHDFVLHNVVYSKHFDCNLLSVRRMWKEHRLKCTFGKTNYFKDKHTGARFDFEYNREFNIKHVYRAAHKTQVDASVITPLSISFTQQSAQRDTGWPPGWRRGSAGGC